MGCLITGVKAGENEQFCGSSADLGVLAEEMGAGMESRAMGGCLTAILACSLLPYSFCFCCALYPGGPPPTQLWRRHSLPGQVPARSPAVHGCCSWDHGWIPHEGDGLCSPAPCAPARAPIPRGLPRDVLGSFPGGMWL